MLTYSLFFSPHLHYFPLSWERLVLLHPASALCFFESVKLLVDILYLKDGKNNKVYILILLRICIEQCVVPLSYQALTW